MITYIKPTNIISIEVEDYKRNYSIRYLERRSFLGLIIRERGFYINPNNIFKEKIDEIPSHSMRIGDLVYYKPNIQIRCKNHFSQKYFDTHTEAREYAQDIADKYGLIPL